MNTVIVPVSGGKDSTCCLLLALKHYMTREVVPVFCDTGWEHPLTYQYLDYLEERLKVNLIRLHETDMLALIRKVKFFPSFSRRFCTVCLKIKPLNRFLGDQKAVILSGERRCESGARANKLKGISPEQLFEYEVFESRKRNKKKTNAKIRYPIVSWSDREVFEFLEKCHVEPNPLYKMGMRRVGCYPCVCSRKSWRKSYFFDDEGKRRVRALASLEKMLQEQGLRVKAFPDTTAESLLSQLETLEKMKLF